VNWSESLAPLRIANFRWYFYARMVNLAGSTMGGLALAFAVLEVSDSASALGAVLAAHSVPMVLFLLAGGVIADRFGRTLVIQVSNVAAGLSQLAIAALVISGTAQLWQLIVLSAVNGVVAAASLPALASILPQLVPREQLQPANVLTSMVRSALTILGPTAAAALVVGVGAGWAVAIDGVTYLISAVLLLGVRLPPPVRAQGTSSVLADLRDGWSFFRRTTWLWVVVLAFCLICAIEQGGMKTLGPVLAQQTSIGEGGWGLILSAEAIGLFVTTLVLLRVRLERPLLWGMVGTAAYGLPAVALGAHPHLGLALVAGFLAGVGIEVFALGWNLAMQENIPEHMLSRAFSYDAFGSFIAIPLGQLAAGPLAQVLGIRRVMFVSGCLIAAIALVTLLSRSVRRLDRLTPARRVGPA
jgi:MFS family permease